MSFCPPVDRHVGIGRGGARGKGDGPNPNVEDLLRKLHLTEEEEAVLDLSDEEEEDAMAPVEWALVGKILSPVSIRTETIRMAMKPAWGNPVGLKIMTIGEKADNMFVVEFESSRDMDCVLSGAPWMVKKYAVLLQEYDGSLSASSIVFDRVEMWVRILDLPLGWMNREKGSRAMDKLGRVVSMDIDADGKASDAFLRARVAIDIDKPIRRGILLRLKGEKNQNGSRCSMRNSHISVSPVEGWGTLIWSVRHQLNGMRRGNFHMMFS
jgi:hypothetical protein